MRTLTIVGCVLALLLSPAVLDMMYWDFSGEGGPGWMKFHPATFVFVVTAAVSMLTLDRRYWNVVFSVRYGPFIVMTVILVLWSAMVSATNSGANGAIGSAITSFLTPALMLISLQAVSRRDLVRMGGALRIFMIVNSIASIAEKLVGIQITFTQTGGDWRSAGFLGHPLTAALLTGLIIVYLLSAANRRGSLASVMPEVVLHAAAMFTFASRSGLLLVPGAVAIGALLPSSGVGGRVSVAQRAAIIAVILIALGVSQLPIDFIQTALSRFTDDSGSADSRRAAIEILGLMDRHSLMWGIDYGLREALQARFGTDIAIEAAWLALTMSFGLVFVLPLFVTLVIALFTIARAMDRSAMMMTIYFLIITAGQISFAAKSTAICQLILFVLTLCQPRTVQAAARPLAVPPITPDEFQQLRAAPAAG